MSLFEFVKSIFTVCSYRVYLHFDHHLTTTVQSPLKMPKKPVVTTNNGLFPVLAANVQNQQNLRFIDGLYRPVVVLRRQVPGVRIPSGAPKEAVAQGKNPSAAASLRVNASRSTKTLAIDPLISKKQITQTGPSE